MPPAIKLYHYPCRHGLENDLKPIRRTGGDCLDFVSAAEQNGTVPFAQTVSDRRSTESPFVQAGPLEILYEDNHLLAVLKPAGISTMGVAAGEASALTLAKQYIKRRYAKPGNVYLGVVSRLDEPVSGLLLLARTSKAAARLSEQFRSRGVEKIYWAIVDGPTEMADFGRLADCCRRQRPVDRSGF